MKFLLENAVAGTYPSNEEALTLADVTDTKALADAASQIRDQGFRNVVTYSRKVFIPLTHLCRDVCHYCTFAQVPRKVKAPYMTIDEVLEVARHGQAMGCKEALFTLGENRNYVIEQPETHWLKWAMRPPQNICSPQPKQCLKKPAFCRTSTQAT